MGHFFDEKTPSLVGRLIGAVMAFSFTILTVLVVPMLLYWKFHLKRTLFPTLDGWALNVFSLWLALVATFAMIIGFIYGGWGVLDIFNLIWRTGEVYDKELIEVAALLRKLILVSLCAPIIIFFISRIWVLA